MVSVTQYLIYFITTGVATMTTAFAFRRILTCALLPSFPCSHTHTRLTLQVAVADPEHSVFFDHFTSAAGDRSITACTASKIEGIGRPRVEPSFVRDVVDTMVRIPAEASFDVRNW